MVVPLTGKPEMPLLYDTMFVESANTATLSAAINRIAMSLSLDPSRFRRLVTDQHKTILATGKGGPSPEDHESPRKSTWNVI